LVKSLPFLWSGSWWTGLGQLEEENRRLRREVRHLAQQRDILKKTLGIIATPSGSDLNG
jgi:hypothetical protein